MGQSKRSRLEEVLRGSSLIAKIMRETDYIDVLVVADPSKAGPTVADGLLSSSPPVAARTPANAPCGRARSACIEAREGVRNAGCPFPGCEAPCPRKSTVSPTPEQLPSPPDAPSVAAPGAAEELGIWRVSEEQVYEALRTSPRGLTEDEAFRRLRAATGATSCRLGSGGRSSTTSSTSSPRSSPSCSRSARCSCSSPRCSPLERAARTTSTSPSPSWASSC